MIFMQAWGYMKTFIKRIITIALFLCLIIVPVVVYGLFVVCPQYHNAYTAAMNDKVGKLQTTECRKIVLVGNSNVAFGFRSDMIEEAFGIPVVNAGLHGAIGNAFHEQVCKINPHEGDIYIVCHTSFDDNDSVSAKEAWITIENNFSLWKLIRLKDIDSMVKGFPSYLARCYELYSEHTGNLSEGGHYTRSAFNEYGDMAVPRTERVVEFSPGGIYISPIGDKCTKRLNNLSKYLEKRGAKLVMAGYPIPDTEFTPSDEEYDKLTSELKEIYEFPVISDYKTYKMNQDLFFDTVYHLNDEGVIVRTQKLIEDIRNSGILDE